MPTLTDESFAALRSAMEKVDLLAKRLLEWRTFGLRTQNSESRFDVFLAVLKGTAGIPTQPQLDQLKSAWSDCDNQLIEMSLLPDSFEAITRVLSDGLPDPTVRTWIDGLVTTGKRVGEDIAQQSFGPLPGHSAEYKAAFTKLSIQRNAKIESEINQLSTLTNALVQKFHNV